MLSLRRPLNRVAFVAPAAVLGVLAMMLASSSSNLAHAASIGQLQQRIGAGRGRISNLSGGLNATSRRLSELNSSIAGLQGRIGRIQTDLNAKRAELLKLRGELISARSRLAKLESLQAHAEMVLSRQLVGGYESDRPDLITVVLEAKGFPDLLERLVFAKRIGNQDVQVVSEVRAVRRAVADQATRLGTLEARQQSIATHVLHRRNDLVRVRLSMVRRQIMVAKSRAGQRGQLASTRGQVAGLEHQLSKLQAARAAAAAAAAAASASSPSVGAAAGGSAGPGGANGSSGAAGAGSSSGPAGGGGSVGSPQTSSGGGYTFPMPKGAVSPPGTWTLDQGVDMSAPGGTPLLAIGSGTIVLHGIGGFGPSAPVLHLDSGQYVYYGHAGPGNMLAIGTHVSAGQAISEVGYGIVGLSSGPHLEIGFCDGSGTPLGGGTASQMLSLLQGAYGG